jgi:hypothetical protein
MVLSGIRTIILPIICIVLGYIIAIKTNQPFYYFMMVGGIELLVAILTVPFLIVA